MDYSRIAKENLNFLNNGQNKTPKRELNEMAEPLWWRAIKRMFGPRFTRRQKFPEFMERYANPPGGWPRRIIRINRSGSHPWGNNDNIRRWLEQLDGSTGMGGTRVRQLLINDEGAFIVLGEDGRYYYLHPDSAVGPMRLPQDWDPYRDSIPESFGHQNWADEGYRSPIDNDPFFGIIPILGLPGLLDPGANPEDEFVAEPPQSIPPLLVRPEENWSPPMRSMKYESYQLNESVEPRWWRVLMRMLYPQQGHRWTFREFMERYANPPGASQRIVIRLNAKPGYSVSSDADKFYRKWLSQYRNHPRLDGSSAREIIVNDEGAWVILAENGRYYYMHPEDGFMRLPEGWNPNTDSIPDVYGHENWADPGYRSPIDNIEFGVAPILGLPGLLDPGANPEDEFVAEPPQSIPPLLVRPEENWSPPMR